MNSSCVKKEFRADSSKDGIESFESFAPDWIRYVFLSQHAGGARGEYSPGTGRRHCRMEQSIFRSGFPCGKVKLNDGVSSDCSIPRQMTHEGCGEIW